MYRRPPLQYRSESRENRKTCSRWGKATPGIAILSQHIFLPENGNTLASCLPDLPSAKPSQFLHIHDEDLETEVCKPMSRLKNSIWITTNLSLSYLPPTKILRLLSILFGIKRKIPIIVCLPDRQYELLLIFLRNFHVHFFKRIFNFIDERKFNNTFYPYT